MDKEEDEIMVSMDGVMKSKAVPPPAEIIGTQFTESHLLFNLPYKTVGGCVRMPPNVKRPEDLLKWLSTWN